MVSKKDRSLHQGLDECVHWVRLDDSGFYTDKEYLNSAKDDAQEEKQSYCLHACGFSNAMFYNAAH